MSMWRREWYIYICTDCSGLLISVQTGGERDWCVCASAVEVE